MATSAPKRRFSAEYIRKQPEYQFVKSGYVSQFSRVSIDLPTYSISRTATGRSDNNDNEQSLRMSHMSPPRPSTTAVIKIVQHVNNKYASISPLPRPKTSVGFVSSVPETKTRGRSKSTSVRRKSCVSAKGSGKANKVEDRKASIYDPNLEKSKTFLHKKNDMFSKTNQYLSEGARPGMRNLQLHYTGVNTEHNDRVIFADLLKAAHRKNDLVEEDVYCMERRLYTKRGDPKIATTFWDREGIIRPHSRPRTCIDRTVAQKKRRRREKINEKNDKIAMGYVPRKRTLRIPSTSDMEELRMNCRYLRIDPSQQTHLYDTGLVFYSQ